MKEKVSKKFNELYGEGAILFASPGRINLIGEHTDYNGGFVFPGAVDTPLYDLDAACRRRLLRWGVMSAPQEVAQHGLRALFRGRSSCIPGVFTKICVCVCRLVPAWLMRCVLRIPAVARLF